MTTTTISSPQKISTDARVNLRTLLWVAPLILIASLIVNGIIRAIAQALDLAPAFRPIAMPIFIPFTIGGVLGALVVFILVARFSKRPYWLYVRLALGALALTFIPATALLITPLGMGDVTLGGVLALMLMHTATAAITISALLRFTRSTRQP